MSPSTITAEPASVLRDLGDPAPDRLREPRLFEPVGPPVAWTRTTYAALIALVALWAAQVFFTWAAWGNLTIDSGHEMYVPALLAQGKVLYRDVWFAYTPGAPCFNSYLFRFFGMNLSVLYWAGSLSALGSAIFLYLTGMRLSSWLVGWTAGAVVILEAFQPSLFCFPLPYAFAAVYGCLVSCLFIWLVINAADSNAWGWMFGAGTAAALALLLKPEYGMACYCTLALSIVVRLMTTRRWRSALGDIAAVMPGVAACGAVVLWMVSLKGLAFIIQDNIMSLPTSYFMKRYGKSWLAYTGFSLTLPAFHDALIRTLPVAAAITAAYACLRWKRSDLLANLLKVLLVLLIILYFTQPVYLSVEQEIGMPLRTIFFPRDMVLYVAIAACAAWLLCWRKDHSFAACDIRIPLVLAFSSLLAFRLLMKNSPWGYSIYYNGPVALGFFLLLFRVIPRRDRSRRFVFLGEAVICLACLTGVAMYAWQAEVLAKDFVPLTTDRGTVRVSKHMAENYAAAIQFMKEKAALGESVLSVPEDTSLYFLSNTICPTRVYLFVPGVLVPGKMTDETIREIDQKRVPYLLWSNRVFPEYGVPVFGRDFDRKLGDYLKSHYRRVGRLIPDTGAYWEWTANIWERNPEAGSK
jgi:hypothetical protein